MKKGERFFVVIFLAFAAFIALLWLQTNRLLRSSSVQDQIVRNIQLVSGGILNHEGFEVGLFPQPTLFMIRPNLVFSGSSMAVEAEKLRVDFNIIPMVWGRAEPSAMYVINGKTDTTIPWLPFLGENKFRNFSLKTGAIRPNLAIPMQFISDLKGCKEAVSAKGHFITPSVEKFEWEKISGRLLIELKGLPLKDPEGAVASAPGGWFLVKDGSLNGSGEINKKQGESSVGFSAEAKITDLGYEVLINKTWTSASAADLDMTLTGSWDPVAEELKLTKSSMEFPFGRLETNGSLRFGTGEIPNLYFSAKDIVLETLVTYFPGIENVLPFKIGFSGTSQWMLTLAGTIDHLSLHLSVDLVQTLLTYGHYFTKPKNIPLTVSADYLVQKGAALSGDFSVRFQDMSLKGNLTDLDMKSGTGQLNILTNKFTMTGLEQFVPALQGYKVGGSAKILANWKGDLRQPDKTQQIFNLTVENGSWTNAAGQGVKNAGFSIDYSPLMLEGRDMHFDIGRSPFAADLKITGIGENPEIAAKISSAEMNPVEICDAVISLLPSDTEQTAKDTLDQIKKSLAGFFEGNEKVKDVTAGILYSGQKWQVPDFQSRFYDGTVKFQGEVDTTVLPIAYRVRGDVDGLDLDRFLSRQNPGKKLLEGSLRLGFSLEGSGWGEEAWNRSLTGRGRFTVVDGKFYFLDLPGAIEVMEPFRGLSGKLEAPNAFREIDFSWDMNSGKISTENFLVKGGDYVVDGEGTFGMDGFLNFRWDVFLNSLCASEIFPDMAGILRKEPKAYFGPITMLVSGPLGRPEIKPDPSRTEDLFQKIQKNKAKSLLYELVLD